MKEIIELLPSCLCTGMLVLKIEEEGWRVAPACFMPHHERTRSNRAAVAVRAFAFDGGCLATSESFYLLVKRDAPCRL